MFSKLVISGIPIDLLTSLQNMVPVHALDKDTSLRVVVTGYYRNRLFSDGYDSDIMLLLSDDATNDEWVTRMREVVSFFSEHG